MMYTMFQYFMLLSFAVTVQGRFTVKRTAISTQQRVLLSSSTDPCVNDFNCNNYISAPDTPEDCFLASTPEGDSFWSLNPYCDTLQSCASSSSCPTGYRCAINTCCYEEPIGPNVCTPICNKVQRTMSSQGLQCLKIYEGYCPHCYRDTNCIWTIGVGHSFQDHSTTYNNLANLNDCCLLDPLTKASGNKLLLSDVAKFENCINEYVSYYITSGQFDALVSEAYHNGCYGLRVSHPIPHLIWTYANQGYYCKAAKLFPQIPDEDSSRGNSEEQQFRNNDVSQLCNGVPYCGQKTNACQMHVPTKNVSQGYCKSCC